MPTDENVMPTDEVVMPTHKIDFDAVIAAELALLDPVVRADSERVSALLDERFVEYGARGALWDRAGTIAALAESPEVGDVETSGFHCVSINSDAILLTYQMANGPRTALRSSVWVRAGEQWRVLFHQATLVQQE
jgi:ribonuclease HI